MVANSCNHPQSTWRELLENRLDRQLSDLLTEHIEICPACRSKFESVCAPPELWTESSQALRDIHDDQGTSRKPEGNEASRASSSIPDAIDGYLIREVVGYGGMGTVYKAWDPRLYRLVAIKVLHPHLATNGTSRSRFEREAQAVAGISHPHVVPIHDVAADHQPPYLVMAFVADGSLQEKIEKEGPLPLSDAIRIAMQIAEGLEAAHSQSLIHRDIKPANVLLEARGQRILITDFGLARALDDASMTASGFLAGTPQYMSPEQALGQKLDHRSDLFSLGSVLYTMLGGLPPFQSDSAIATLREVAEARPKPIHEHEPRLPMWVQPLLEAFHARDPSQRIPSAQEAAWLLKACLQHVLSPTTTSLPSRLTPKPRSRVSSTMSISIVAILFVASLAGGYFAPIWLRNIGWMRNNDIRSVSSEKEFGQVQSSDTPPWGTAGSPSIDQTALPPAQGGQPDTQSSIDGPHQEAFLESPSEDRSIERDLDRLDLEMGLLIDWLETPDF